MNRYFHPSLPTLYHLKQLQGLLAQLQPEAEPLALLVPRSMPPHGHIIVFPGSFNPLTNAHLALMKQAQRFVEQQHLDMGKKRRIISLYAAMSKLTVDKEHIERPLLLERAWLVRRVMRSRFKQGGVLLFNRGLYVEQARAVRVCFPGVARLLFLIGFDKIVQILDPRYYQERDAALRELFSLAELLVAPRAGYGLAALAELLQRAENEPFARSIHALPFNAAYRDISSSRIREQVAKYRHDVPQEVRRFMRDTRAYAPPLQLADGSEIDYYAERIKVIEALLKTVSV